MSAITIDTNDKTIGLNLGGTWIPYSDIAKEAGISEEYLLETLAEEDADYIRDKLSDVLHSEIVKLIFQKAYKE